MEKKAQHLLRHRISAARKNCRHYLALLCSSPTSRPRSALQPDCEDAFTLTRVPVRERVQVRVIRGAFTLTRTSLDTFNSLVITRKLSYRKDDRGMRRMYGCPENFRESLTTPTATFPEIFNGLLFRLSL